MTHVCDYCGAKYNLESDDDMIACEACDEQRLYNLKENRKSVHYQHVGHAEEPLPLIEEEEEPVRKKEKKKSKDIRAKKAPSYAEKMMSRYNYKSGF